MIEYWACIPAFISEALVVAVADCMYEAYSLAGRISVLPASVGCLTLPSDIVLGVAYVPPPITEPCALRIL